MASGQTFLIHKNSMTGLQNILYEFQENVFHHFHDRNLDESYNVYKYGSFHNLHILSSTSTELMSGASCKSELIFGAKSQEWVHQNATNQPPTMLERQREVTLIIES